MRHLDGVGSYVEGALRLLQFVEARRPTGRRFGPDADARWGGFRGDLETVDRIELMIRDADAEWPSGFGARSVYALHGVAEDDPFGSQWEGMDPVAAEELWRRVKTEAPPKSPKRTLESIAAAWGLTLRKHPVDSIEPTDHLLVVGPSAIASTIEAFTVGESLDWSEQVVVIATAPSVRQLATAATAVLNASRPTQIFAADEKVPKLKRGAKLVASKDADPSDLAVAELLIKG